MPEIFTEVEVTLSIRAEDDTRKEVFDQQVWRTLQSVVDSTRVDPGISSWHDLRIGGGYFKARFGVVNVSNSEEATEIARTRLHEALSDQALAARPDDGLLSFKIPGFEAPVPALGMTV